MYQDSSAQPIAAPRENLFAIAFERAIERGGHTFPPMTKDQAFSIRSRMNHYRRKEIRNGTPGAQRWEYVVNSCQTNPDGTVQIVMQYDRAFWKTLEDSLLGDEGRKAAPEPSPEPTSEPPAQSTEDLLKTLGYVDQ